MHKVPEGTAGVKGITPSKRVQRHCQLGYMYVVLLLSLQEVLEVIMGCMYMWPNLANQTDKKNSTNEKGCSSLQALCRNLQMQRSSEAQAFSSLEAAMSQWKVQQEWTAACPSQGQPMWWTWRVAMMQPNPCSVWALAARLIQEDGGKNIGQ